MWKSVPKNGDGYKRVFELTRLCKRGEPRSSAARRSPIPGDVLRLYSKNELFFQKWRAQTIAQRETYRGEMTTLDAPVSGNQAQKNPECPAYQASEHNSGSTNRDEQRNCRSEGFYLVFPQTFAGELSATARLHDALLRSVNLGRLWLSSMRRN
ncbi:hypothetical protein, partial [Caballeronia sp. M23-90]